ncbi:MAG: epoxyqueuosine reductase QueH [Candidatus Omnitrophota bacterium]
MNPIDPLLLHVCCAPCSGGVIETLLEENTIFTLYFYNPNIHPKSEYVSRKNEIIKFAKKLNIGFIDEDYAPAVWFERIKNLEREPERGLRCQVCFDMRLEKAAKYAHEHGFKFLSTTNGISRWKDAAQVRRALINAVSLYPGLSYLNRDWRKNNGIEKMSIVRKREDFYQQTYCGCVYSMSIRNNKKAL